MDVRRDGPWCMLVGMTTSPIGSTCATCKQEATRWVHRYAAGGAAFAALPIPFSTSVGLAALETHLLSVIGEIYGEGVGAFASATAGGTFSAAGQGLKFVACQAACFIPGFGIPIRMAIAGATIEALGHAVIAHFERKHTGKLFVKKPPA
jgi:uncharacterized protein (DUF697 family)